MKNDARIKQREMSRCFFSSCRRVRSGVGDFYEMLTDPSNIGLPNPGQDYFGWFVFIFDDLGSPLSSQAAGGFDGKMDIVVHSEGADFGSVQGAGNLVAYFGDYTGPSGSMVDEVNSFVLWSPTGPGTDYRFGRNAARIDWPDVGSSVLKPRLLVNEPDTTVGGVAHSGQVLLLDLPFNQTGSNPNVWTTPLTSPLPHEDWEIFGAGMAVGDFIPGIPGLEFAVSSRARDVTPIPGGTTELEAGEVYVFHR